MLDFLKKIFSKRRDKNYLLGVRAEKFASKYIKKNTPYKILTKNFRYKNYEVDIIAYDKSSNSLIIVEVKARRDNALVSGYNAALFKSKINSVLACKREYMKISPHKFDGFNYSIFEIMHNETGEIIEYFFHENITLKRTNKRGKSL